jgi:hypothetical protein
MAAALLGYPMIRSTICPYHFLKTLMTLEESET